LWRRGSASGAAPWRGCRCQRCGDARAFVGGGGGGRALTASAAQTADDAPPAGDLTAALVAQFAACGAAVDARSLRAFLASTAALVVLDGVMSARTVAAVLRVLPAAAEPCAARVLLTTYVGGVGDAVEPAVPVYELPPLSVAAVERVLRDVCGAKVRLDRGLDRGAAGG
jgi:hypothetical protein